MTTSDPKRSPVRSPEADDGGAALLDRLRADGVVTGAAPVLAPLTGGVSSEIYLVEDDGRRFVVKRALPKLRVRDDWYADPARNANEQAYLQYVAGLLPGAVPAVLHGSQAGGYFTMEYLPRTFTTWKQRLLDGHCEAAWIDRAAGTLAAIHRASRGNADLHRRFDTTAAFHALRIEPYLLTTGRRHPRLQARFITEAARLESTRQALVHGDFSPKNVLVEPESGRLVLVDCEVAWYGDPAFDVAFVLTHLLLKAVLHGGDRAATFVELARAFVAGYRSGIADPDWAAEIDERVATLLPMLLLARVDGKSPVEYLTPARQAGVRAAASALILEPPPNLAALFDAWERSLPMIAL